MYLILFTKSGKPKYYDVSRSRKIQVDKYKLRVDVTSYGTFYYIEDK